MKLKPLSVLVLCSVCATAQAELIQLEFTDTKDQTRQVTPAQGGHINPKSALALTISGGLDRKFRVRLLDATGSEVDRVDTSIISVSDRIRAAGKEFYGKRVAFKYKPLQTTYTVSIDLLDLQGNVVENEEYKFSVDTTPPEVSGSMSFHKHAWGNGDLTKFDYLENREFRLNGISDDGSGLDKAFFLAKLQGSNEEHEVSVLLDKATGLASWLKPSPDTYRRLFHKNRSDYTIGFRILDKAGNETRVTRVSGFNGICGPKEVTHVWNPKTSQWDQFTEGMEVYENPYKFRIAVPRSEHTDTNGGRFGYNWTPSDTDSEYVYREHKAYVPVTSSYYTQFSDTGYCGSIYQTQAPAVLAPGVDEAPKFSGMSYLVQGESDWVQSHTIRRNTPYVVDKAELRVHKRGYEQTAEITGHGKCTIPANQTKCVIDINYVRDSGNGYAPYSIHVKSTDGRFSGHFGHFLTYWDFDAPEFEGVSYDNEYVTFTVFDSDAVNDWRRGNWLPSVMELRAVNKATGDVIKTPLVHKSEPNYQSWWRKHSLKELPEGEYRLEAYVKDTYGNERTHVVAETFGRDSTPPTVQFMVDGAELGDTLRGLENLRIRLSDKHTAEITQIQLVGGPTSDDVYLAWTEVGKDEYRPEYPRMFPSPNSDVGYELLVSVRDSFGNTATHKTSFEYYPANLIEIGRTKTLPVSLMLKTRKDQPIGMIESNELRTDSGAIATGPQEVHFTLRADSPYPVKFAGETIQPGETKVVSVDLGESGEIRSPVIPAEDLEGEAHFMLDIPQLRSKFD
ncbi:TPA: Ig-like domain-containing protein [Vibrio parahaemolyticus]|uniref:Ig-like domain-containing protein n=1 Tax=Vibrio campbellii TaxID=680 RepID=UPI001F07F424|nr:Ig-like domain-containing protein [Vibrio campbellii]UMM06757.1 Ig-like domain-containing protein [Vibrio campbellii]